MVFPFCPLNGAMTRLNSQRFLYESWKTAQAAGQKIAQIIYRELSNVAHHSNDVGSAQPDKQPARKSKRAKGKNSDSLQEGFQEQCGWESVAICHGDENHDFPLGL